MKPARHAVIAVVASLFVFAGPVLAQPGQSQDAGQGGGSRQPAPSGLINIAFEGGSAAEYIGAVRIAFEDLGRNPNILVAPEADMVPMAAVELRSVGLKAALSLVDRLSIELPDQIISLTMGRLGGPANRGEELIYRIDAHVSRQVEKMEPSVSRVWTIAHVVESGLSAEDVLTAIETAMDLFGEDAPPARLQFHEETGLLLGRGHPAQMEAVENVISALNDGIGLGREHEKETDELMRALQNAEMRFVNLQDQLAMAQAMAQEGEKWRVRAEALKLDADAARSQLHAAEAQVMDYRAKIMQLELQIRDKQED